MNDEQYKSIMERLDLIEFRQELLFNNSVVDRILFEYGLTRIQYREIMNVMDEFRRIINEGKDCSHTLFESKIYSIVPEHEGEFHMCENLAKGFMQEGRWEEVFFALYGDMPKYSNLKKK